jgi:haloalkane dehalogenase
VIAADETFGGTWPFKARFSDAPGFRMHYIEEGRGEPIVMLHGQPTWGYLYRRLIPPLALDHRVVVPDHMGFGKSETPSDRTYTLQTHVENLSALLDDLDLHDVTFVAQDWGGPIAAAYAVRNPGRVARLLLMNTATGLGETNGATPITESPWFQWVSEGRESGRYEAVLGNLGSTALSVMRLLGFERIGISTRTWVDAYSSPFPDEEACRGAIAFPLDLVDGTALPYLEEGRGEVEHLTAIPSMLIEGLADRAIPPDYAIAEYRSLWPEGRVVELPGVGHFCQEDAPETLLPLVRQFLDLNPITLTRRKGARRPDVDAAGIATIDERIDNETQRQLDTLLAAPNEQRANVAILLRVLKGLEDLELAETTEEQEAAYDELPEHVEGDDELDEVLAEIRSAAPVPPDDRAQWQRVRLARRAVIDRLAESIDD